MSDYLKSIDTSCMVYASYSQGRMYGAILCHMATCGGGCLDLTSLTGCTLLDCKERAPIPRKLVGGRQLWLQFQQEIKWMLGPKRSGNTKSPWGDWKRLHKPQPYSDLGVWGLSGTAAWSTAPPVGGQLVLRTQFLIPVHHLRELGHAVQYSAWALLGRLGAAAMWGDSKGRKTEGHGHPGWIPALGGNGNGWLKSFLWIANRFVQLTDSFTSV